MIRTIVKSAAVQLSPNFNSREWDCHCQYLACKTTLVDMRTVIGLEQIREEIGVPLVLRSGFRCPLHNADVGGKANSLHLYGQAADIAAAGIHVDTIAHAAKRVAVFSEGGIGIYYGDGFVHVDSRGRAARWIG